MSAKKPAPSTGAAGKRPRAKKSAFAGLSPLDVMLGAMRQHYEAGRYDEAAELAKDAAPYVHPRLSTVDNKPSGNVGYTAIPVAERDPIPAFPGAVDAAAGAARAGDPPPSRH